MYKIFITILFLFLFIFCLSAEEKFKPWNFDLSFGINLADGNTDKIGGQSSLQLERISKIDEFIFKINVVYSETENKKDTNKGDLILNYDYDFLKKESFFIFIFPSYNEFHDLKYRIQNGIGLKHTFYKGDNADYSLSGAILYEIKKYLNNDSQDELSRLSIRPKLKYSMDSKSTIYFILFYQPKINLWKDYRILSEFNLELKIFKNLYFEFKVKDEYNNIVLEGIEKNDLFIINSIKLKL